MYVCMYVCCSRFLGISIYVMFIFPVFCYIILEHFQGVGVNLAAAHILYLASLVIVALGGFKHRGECVVAICCLLI